MEEELESAEIILEKGKKSGRGRPTDFREIYTDVVYLYIDQCKKEIETFTNFSGAKGEGYDRIVIANIPTKTRLARILRTTEETLDNWADKHEEFFSSLKQLMLEQKDLLIQNGLSSDYNTAITKLLLSANHKMNEKTEVENNTKVILQGDQELINQFREINASRETKNNN